MKKILIILGTLFITNFVFANDEDCFKKGKKADLNENSGIIKEAIDEVGQVKYYINTIPEGCAEIKLDNSQTNVLFINEEIFEADLERIKLVDGTPLPSLIIDASFYDSKKFHKIEFKQEYKGLILYDSDKETELMKFVFDENQQKTDVVANNFTGYLKKIKNKFPKFKENELYFDNAGILHVFLDEELNLIDKTRTVENCYSGGNISFQYHVIAPEDKEIDFSLNKINVYPIKDINENDFDSNNSDDAVVVILKYIFHDSEVWYSNADLNYISIAIHEKADGDEEEKLIVQDQFKIEKCRKIMVSIDVGMFYSFLPDPDNIQRKELPSGDFTLTADNATGKMKGAVAASFYFKPRIINHMNQLNFMERWSASVGLGIGENFVKDYFFGLNYEVTWGLKITGGFNVAQVNRVVGYDDFDFNKQIYTPSEVKTYDRWAGNGFIGVTLDARVLAEMIKYRKNEDLNSSFNSSSNSNSNN